ncbi:PREDICTED: uncharacterized protein LOC108765408 isoform X2 [Trachymyrmex cornetzi]|uniref:uncharacterized protein LOC108765408 isoform X2 n=1 Tax=Trachymyrmex cornetzi TaxID=471704 RepID=UPI00084F07CB|nr:PREDICTED: uncharacterized protein LOC108765408 isoform X2 [Trachymyrmex cornetzi]
MQLDTAKDSRVNHLHDMALLRTAPWRKSDEYKRNENTEKEWNCNDRKGSWKEKQHGLFAGMKSIPPTCYDVFDFYPLRLSVFPEITLTQMRNIQHEPTRAHARRRNIYLCTRHFTIWNDGPKSPLA